MTFTQFLAGECRAEIGVALAHDRQGTLSLVGIDGVAIGGTVTVAVNTTGLALDESLPIPGSTADPVEVSFASGAIVKRFSATGAQISVLGQTVTADLAFEQSGGDLAGCEEHHGPARVDR